MPPKALLKLGVALLILGALGLAASAWAMADRLAQRDNPMVYFQDPIPLENFEFRGQPVSLTLVENPPTPNTPDNADTDDERLATDLQPSDTMSLRLDFRGRSVHFPIRDETDQQNFPDAPEGDRLALLAGWFKVLLFVDGVSNLDEVREGLRSGDVKTRLVVAARYQPPGLKPTWAAVQRQNWLYRVAELHPEADNPVTLTQNTYRELDAIGTPGRRTDAELIPAADERASKLWMHYVMQQVTPPKFFRAKDRDLDLALDAMGWTWPAALASGFALVASVIILGFAAKARLA